ncbi:MAG: hypothetical protein AAF704_07080, partial [Cyanobacteria bacterium P01_D01_bin.123]
ATPSHRSIQILRNSTQSLMSASDIEIKKNANHQQRDDIADVSLSRSAFSSTKSCSIAGRLSRRHKRVRNLNFQLTIALRQ